MEVNREQKLETNPPSKPEHVMYSKPTLIVKCNIRFDDETISIVREELIDQYKGNVVVLPSGFELA